MPYENDVVEFAQQNIDRTIEGAQGMTAQVLSFAQNYIDQGIDFAKQLAPKVWAYLQVKCYVSGTMAIVGLVVAIIIAIVAYSLTPGYIKREKRYNKKFKFDTANNGSHGGRVVITILLFVVAAIMIINFLATIDTTILAFTDVCPIDTALEMLKSAGSKVVNR